MENNKTEQKPYLRWFQSDFEEDTDQDFEWDCLIDDLNELLQEVNPDGYWYCKVKNFGWRSQNGYSFLKFTTAEELIQKVLPNCECSFNIFRQKENLSYTNMRKNHQYLLAAGMKKLGEGSWARARRECGILTNYRLNKVKKAVKAVKTVKAK